MKYNIISIADLHFGAFPADILMYELEEVFFPYIDKLGSDLDLVTINGDTFDEKISLNSKAALMAVVTFKKLLRKASEYNFKIRVIKGTKSHDNDQLKILELLVDEYKSTDFNIIYTVGEEELFPGFRVLYIPEEYINVPVEEYYKDFLYSNRFYDMIFMHGMVTDAAFVSKSQESEIIHAKAPIFETKDLLKVSTLVSAGHIHTKMEIKQDFYYNSSFSRWMHGEEGDKGFMHFIYDDNKRYEMKFIKNKKAREFITMEFSIDDKIFDQDAEGVLDSILWHSQEVSGCHNLKLRINIPESYSQTNVLIESLKEVFSNHINIKLDIRNEKVLNQDNKTQETIDLLMDRYGYIFDKSIPYEDKIQLFIKDRYGKDINIDTIKRSIYKS